MSTISDILNQTLDLIGSEDANGSSLRATSEVQQPTASSILRKERQRIKRKLEEVDETDFMGVSLSNKRRIASSDQPTGESMYMDQISSSSVPAPKAWNVKKAVAIINNVDRRIVEKKQRGSDYQQKLSHKFQAKQSKAKLRNKLKHT